MRSDGTILYEQFIAARLKAVELTDLYRDTAHDDPRRSSLWQGVIRQTEAARLLLETWLQSGEAAQKDKFGFEKGAGSWGTASDYKNGVRLS